MTRINYSLQENNANIEFCPFVLGEVLGVILDAGDRGLQFDLFGIFSAAFIQSVGISIR